MNSRKVVGRFGLAVFAIAFMFAGVAWWSVQQAQAVPAGLTRPVLSIGLDAPFKPLADGAKVRTLEEPAGQVSRLLAQHNNVPLVTVPWSRMLPKEPAGARPALVLTYAGSEAQQKLAASTRPLSLPVVSRPAVLMRSDTSIRTWADLAGRSVCVVRDSIHQGYAAQFGAAEQVYPAPADSLLALRVGECDAALQESALIDALVKLPEWKKFSATLPPGRGKSLVALIPREASADARVLQQQLERLASSTVVGRLYANVAKDIAFEVYLDQAVEDCH